MLEEPPSTFPRAWYTLRPFMYGSGKVEAISRYADEHDLDLAESAAYSDSASDLPMLRAVGNAVVVNPDDALLEVARAEGWRVMRFEKLGRYFRLYLNF